MIGRWMLVGMLVVTAPTQQGGAQGKQARGDTIALMHGGEVVMHRWRAGGGTTREERDVTTRAAQLRRPRSVELVAEGAVSTLYTCSVTEKEVDVPEVAALRDFAAGAGPLLVDPLLVRAFGGLSAKSLASDTGVSWRPVAEEVAARQDSLETLLRDYVRPARVLVQQKADSMGRVEATAAVAVARSAIDSLTQVRGWASHLGCGGTTCAGSRFGITIARQLDRLRQATQRLRAAVNADPNSVTRSDGLDLLILVDASLAKGDDLIALGHDTDALLDALLKAAPNTACGAQSVALWKGKTLTATVSPRSHPLLSRVARIGKYERVVTVQPDWVVRPALGLSAYRTPSARFAKYGGTTAPNSMKEIFVSGYQDARLLYGVTLGMTYRHADQRTARVPVAVWLPEVFVKPDETNRAVGVGAGLSLSVLKVGYGVGWIRHAVLDGQTLGQLLTDANLVKTRDVYGKPRRYVSVSLTGLPPFLYGGK